MKDKKEIIKKIKNGLKVAVATTLLAVSLTSCAVPQQDYASQEEIIEVAETLDCDTGYLMKDNGNFLRMKHNDGEPIYVCFDESYSEDLKALAKESLDCIFGIVGKINNNYHYEIVDKTTFDLKLNKTKIYYTFGKHITDHGTHQTVAYGHAESRTPWYNQFTDNPVMDYYKINVNPDVSDEKKIKSTYIHEGLHLFGLDDVYTTKALQTTTKYYGNTYMNNSVDFDMLTPNDVACLISLYADDDCNIEQMKYYLEKYEAKFYKRYAEQCKEKLGTNEDFEEEEFEFVTSIITEDLDKNRHGYKYKVTVEDDKYLFEIYDYFTKELLDSCNGDITTQNGVMVLKDIELKVGFRPYDKQESYEDGFVQNLTFLMKDGKAVMYNYHNNNASHGTINAIEKSLTQ